MSGRARNWMLTLWKDFDLERIAQECERITYIVGQEEICPTTGQRHIQAYAEFNDKMSMKAVKECFNDRTMHCETRKGTQGDAIQYCTKLATRATDGRKYEYGIKKQQGKRTDLENAVTDLKTKTVQEVIETYPNLLRYDKALERQKYRQNECPRTWVPWVEVLIGPPGCGKTRKIWDNEDHKEVYTLPEPSSGTIWFDGYTGQKVVLIDDFCGNIRYNFLLQLLDRYPMKVNIKGGMVNFNPHKIYITSNYEVAHWYTQDVSALRRRISVTWELGPKEVPRSAGVILNPAPIIFTEEMFQDLELI